MRLLPFPLGAGALLLLTLVAALGSRAVAQSPREPFTAPTANNLSGAWATGSGNEPSGRYLVVTPECNTNPGFWELDQRGSIVRARTVPPSRNKGIATPRELPAGVVLEGRVRWGLLTLGNTATGYRLRYESASGHLRGTHHGAPFWAVPLQIVRPPRCNPPR